MKNIHQALRTASSPCYVLDGMSRIVFINSALETLTGWIEAEIVGETCHFQSGAEANSRESLLSSLALPAEVWRGQPIQISRTISNRAGTVTATILQAFPVRDQKNGVSLAIVNLSESAPLNPLTQLNTLLLHEALVASRRKQPFPSKEVPLVGDGIAYESLIARIRLAATSDCPVWIFGESGVGKEQVARVIHQKGRSSGGAFVPLDCRSTLPADLVRVLQELETSELDLPAGLHLGTAYFSHFTSMRADLQFQLAQRVCQKSGHRVIIATETSPEQLVLRGVIPAELFASLGVITIPVSPLRNRTAEIPLFAQFILEERPAGIILTQPTSFAPAVLAQFVEYDWPGNFDELRDVVVRAREAAKGARVEMTDLPFSFRTGRDAQLIGPKPVPALRPLDETLTAIESEEVLRALELARYNKTFAAELLGIPRARLYRTLEKMGLGDKDLPKLDISAGEFTSADDAENSTESRPFR